MIGVRNPGLIVLMIVLAVWLPPALRAAEEDAPQRSFFLPKSPVAAAYVLGRLSNQELIAAPRSEFVYVALLQRPGLERKYRLEALEGLAKLRATDTLTELIGGLVALDKKGTASETVLRDLSAVLLQFKPDELAAKREGLTTLATESEQPLTRQIAWAGLITADPSIEPAWQRVEAESSNLTDLVLAVPLVREASLRAAFRSKIEPLLHQTEPAEVRRAAITAIVAVPGQERETFNTLAALVQTDTERALAVASLQRIPRKSWPADQAAPLISSLVAWLQELPVDQRTGPEATSAFQFATDLTALLPSEQAAVVGKTLRALGVSVIVIRTIPEQMQYDKSLIAVEAGKPVEIILINDDVMPHNLLVVAPGAAEEIGPAAENMPAEPDAQGRLYVPDSPKVLHATRMVDPGQQARLSFTAPIVPGDYQYVCTFPGHWRRMLGTLAVVLDVEAYLASHAAAVPKVTEWKVEDLAPALTGSGSGRNVARGKELFTKLACASCHKFGAEGIAYGPDLTGVFEQFNRDRTELLRHILEPSRAITNRYRNFEFELKDGESVFGMIVDENPEAFTVQTGPSDSLIQTLKKSEVQTQRPQNFSLMPLALLNTLTKEEILDLLAYLEAGGDSREHTHEH
ncbi:MAG: c-type cytochrome [Verrucomicrobia bacterium]|nr:c-type cytochrome [Verrucomicrobiota bacterium]